jgi:hypothetical protein
MFGLPQACALRPSSASQTRSRFQVARFTGSDHIRVGMEPACAWSQLQYGRQRLPGEAPALEMGCRLRGHVDSGAALKFLTGIGTRKTIPFWVFPCKPANSPMNHN